MDDAELFCAYSRATTLCIALYDAEVLGVHGANCLFQAMVMAEPGQQELAESARINAQTDELVRANFGAYLVRPAELGAWLGERLGCMGLLWIETLYRPTG